MAKEVNGELSATVLVVKVKYDNRHRSAALMQGDPSIPYLTLNRAFGSGNEALRSRRPGPIDFPFRNTHFYIKSPQSFDSTQQGCSIQKCQFAEPGNALLNTSSNRARYGTPRHPRLDRWARICYETRNPSEGVSFFSIYWCPEWGYCRIWKGPGPTRCSFGLQI